MLLTTKNVIIPYSLLILITLTLSSCAPKSYHSYKYKNYQKIKNKKIKNSPAMHRATMKSYVVLGKRYYPTLAKIDDTSIGIASWYGPDFHLKKTSNGETYNMYALTAAHKTLPMNTMVKVKNLENGKSVIVRINDRGPFVNKRVIDLSNKAAHEIDMIKKGTTKVSITILGFNAKIATTTKEREESISINEYFLQVGAFEILEGAKNVQNKFEMILGDEYPIIIKKGYNKQHASIHRVFISGFKSETQAIDFKEKNSLSGAIIIAK